MKSFTLEFLMSLVWMGVYFYDTTDDTALVISVMFLIGHSVIVEIRKANKEYFDVPNAD
jgi:hypothetical protein